MKKLAVALLSALALVAPAWSQNDDISGSGGKSGVEHGTGQACVCRVADCTGLTPTKENGCPNDGTGTKNRWIPDNRSCPQGVNECPCETSDGHYVNAKDEHECHGKTQGLTTDQVLALEANGLDPAQHECQCCHCNAQVGGGTNLGKECDERNPEAWNPEVHSCSSSFWIVVFVVLTLAIGGVVGVQLTKKKAEFEQREDENRDAMRDWDDKSKTGKSDGDTDDA